MLVSIPLKAAISSEYFILALAFCTAVVVMAIAYLVGILRSPEEGITRARQKLMLSYAETRRIHGQDMYGIPSRFLREIPTHLLHEVRPKVQVSCTYSAGAPRSFGHAAIEAPPLKLGANVSHPKFGRGVVIDYEGTGAHARVQVNFDSEGSKWLVLAYANLQVL